MPKNHKRVGDHDNLIQMNTLQETLGSFNLINSFELSKIKGGCQDSANNEDLSGNSEGDATAMQQESQQFSTLSNVMKK
jgi:hypothetical protein